MEHDWLKIHQEYLPHKHVSVLQHHYQDILAQAQGQTQGQAGEGESPTKYSHFIRYACDAIT